jgi:Uma2 family endonuclease
MMMLPIAADEVITADEFERLPNRDRYELVDGRLAKKPPMSPEAVWVTGEIYVALVTFIEAHQLGWIFPPDGEFVLFSDRPNTIRRPDVAFLRHGRLSGDELPCDLCRLAPDLAIEITSPMYKAEDLEVKIAEYLAAGIRLVWVVHPITRTVYVYRADGSVSRLTDAAELTGEDVLPGFVYPIRDLFPAPAPAAP